MEGKDINKDMKTNEVMDVKTIYAILYNINDFLENLEKKITSYLSILSDVMSFDEIISIINILEQLKKGNDEYNIKTYVCLLIDFLKKLSNIINTDCLVIRIFYDKNKTIVTKFTNMFINFKKIYIDIQEESVIPISFQEPIIYDQSLYQTHSIKNSSEYDEDLQLALLYSMNNNTENDEDLQLALLLSNTY